MHVHVCVSLCVWGRMCLCVFVLRGVCVCVCVLVCVGGGAYSSYLPGAVVGVRVVVGEIRLLKPVSAE
jgi:hypothetical protein